MTKQGGIGSVTINCDLIVHSRGQNVSRDNLIALEMKKSTGRKVDQDKDRNRLECLTKSPKQDVWSYDGKALPEHVCGYKYEKEIEKKPLFVRGER